MEKIEKTVTVTITVGKDRYTQVDFLEPESGDHNRLVIKTDDLFDVVKARLENIRVGAELLSWVSLMDEELYDIDVDDEMEV